MNPRPSHWTWRDRFTSHWPIGCKSFGSNSRRGEISTSSPHPVLLGIWSVWPQVSSTHAECCLLARFRRGFDFQLEKKKFPSLWGRDSYFRWRDLWMPSTKGLIKGRWSNMARFLFKKVTQQSNLPIIGAGKYLQSRLLFFCAFKVMFVGIRCWTLIMCGKVENSLNKFQEDSLYFCLKKPLSFLEYIFDDKRQGSFFSSNFNLTMRWVDPVSNKGAINPVKPTDQQS